MLLPAEIESKTLIPALRAILAKTLAEKHEQINELRAAVSSLSGSQQSLITMKYTQGLTNAQIGKRLNKTEGAIKQLNRRTLKALEAILDSDIQ